MDLRKYSRQTNIRLFVGGVILIFLVGDGLIYAFYGAGAALSGLLCLGLGLAPILLIFLVFLVIDFIVRRHNSI